MKFGAAPNEDRYVGKWQRQRKVCDYVTCELPISNQTLNPDLNPTTIITRDNVIAPFLLYFPLSLSLSRFVLR